GGAADGAEQRAGADGGVGERAAHAGEERVGGLEQLLRHVAARGDRAHQDEERDDGERIGARQGEWHGAEHLQRPAPAVDGGVAEEPARGEREADRHAEEDQQQQADDAEDADQPDAHFSPSFVKNITAAASADPIMPASTGAQYQMRGMARSEVTSW